MECDETGTIEVKVLSEEDSWLLFQKRAGDVVNSVRLELAKEVANECKGLPLALATLGRALRNKDETVWENALLQLRRSIFRGMTPVVTSIKLSYTFLPDRESRMCFLTCCLFPEDYKIDMETLLCYLMGGKSLSDVDTLLEAGTKLHAILDELVCSCLLLRDEEGQIMMHDVVRDAAISIGCEEGNGFIVKAGMELINWPNLDLAKCERLTLMSTNFRCVLPYQIRAPCILTLSLNDSKDLKEIPTNFFKEMKTLVTLDLSRTDITSLPPSFSCLENLQTLLMEKCYNLDNISQIEGLMRLEIVSLSDCTKVKFSEGLGKLTNLKMLDLYHNFWIRKFPPKVISSLYQLEKLNILGLMIEGNEVVNLTEIACLTRLASLCIYLNGECLSQDIPSLFKNLTEFRIVSMAQRKMDNSYEQFIEYRMKEFKRSMYLSIPPIPVAPWVFALLERTICLFLNICRHLRSVVQLDPRGLVYNNWKVLHVYKCHELKYLATTVGAENTQGFAFNNLEELYFGMMDSLEEICDGTLPQGFLHKLRVLELSSCKHVKNLVTWDQSIVFSVYTPSPIFANLRDVCIYSCAKLMSVFPMRVVRHLLQLEKLVIDSCSYMEMIVDNGEDCYSEQDKSVLPRLKILCLTFLPRLLSFNRPRLLLDFPALEELEVTHCQNLKRLPFNANNAPKLEKFYVSEKDWFERLEWQDQNFKSRMDSLRKLKYWWSTYK